MSKFCQKIDIDIQKLARDSEDFFIIFPNKGGAI